MENKVFIVTGTTSGIGKALALEIAKTGQTLVMIARDVDRGQSSLQEIRRQAPNPNIDLQAHDRTAQQRLWEMSEALSGLESTKGDLPITDPHF